MPRVGNETLATLTFLCTDIVESTRHWQEDRQQMRERLAWHDRLLAETISHYGGDLFKTRGDGIFAAFPTAPTACEAARALQKALAKEFGSTFLVRTVLSSGEAEYRDGDYFGLTLSRAARLLEIAHGGQILLAEATARLYAEAEPGADAWLLELGIYPLRSLEQPERLFQLRTDGLPSDFPPLRSVHLPPNNLPRRLTTFIGREREVTEVERLLGQTRLLTLLGPGGSGKTRLSLQVAENLLPAFPGGVWFVDLAPVVDPALLVRTVAAALRLREESGASPLDTLESHLRPRKALILLDNCEHLIGECARLVEQLVASCPELILMATSREALELFGEVVWSLPGLSLPPEGLKSPPRLLRYEAIRLFVERASAAAPGFRLTGENAMSCAQICRRLDGIPLAIELAAAWTSTLTAEQIEVRLNDRFAFLNRGSRTALPRQQTLRGALAWSENLLRENERILWRRLAVFAGSFTLEATETICADTYLPQSSVLEALFGLVQKSLVLHEGTRYRLLETIREYGSERLKEAGETDAFARRHLTFYTALAEEAEPYLRGPDQKAWLDRLDAEFSNVTAALLRATDGPLALRLTNALFWFWWIRGHRLQAHQSLGTLLQRFPDTDKQLRALSLRNRGIFSLDEDEARQDLIAALAIYEVLGQRSDAAILRGNLGIQASNAQRFDEALVYLQQANTYYLAHPDPRRQAQILLNLGTLQMRMHHFPEARLAYEQSLSLYADLQDPVSQANLICNLGYLAYAQNDPATAFRCFLESLERRVQLNERSFLAKTICAITLILHQERTESFFIAQLLGKISYLQAEGSDLLDERESSDYTDILTSLSGSMPLADLEHWRSEGSSLEWQQMLEELQRIGQERFPCTNGT